jgi:hypothetical protein
LGGTLLALTSGCDFGGDTDEESTGPVCGLIERDLVEALTGDRRFTAVGDLSSVGDDDAGGGDCQVVDGQRTFMTASVAPLATRAEMRATQAQLAREYAALAKTCPGRQRVTEPGRGNACVEEQEIDLAVVTPGRLIRVRAERVSPDVTLDQVTAIAADIEHEANR